VTNYRLESDSVGEKKVPQDAYYGVQSLRASENFRITGRTVQPELIKALAEVKKAAAITNMDLNLLDTEKGQAIVKACDEIIGGKLHDQFITDPIQGGAGTSINMNMNEVVANRATEILGGKLGDYSYVHPNDHVNFGQSTNDVIPSSGKIAAIRLLDKALIQVNNLVEALMKKSEEFDHIIKMGRTQLQDAIPIRLGQEFNAYSNAIKRDIVRIKRAKEELKHINIGATAIGTGLNTDELYVKNIVPNLNKITGLDLVQNDDLIDGTQNLDVFVSVSGAIKACAVSLSKISNDLRLLSSGPRTGLGEINLPPKQNGSSIMPGKINPVIPEVVSQIAFNIIGNDLTITMAAEAGQLELNAFEPVLFYNLYESIETLTHGIETFIVNCIDGITANEEHCRHLMETSVGIITALCPHIGYKEAAKIAKHALKTKEPIRKLILEEELLDEDDLNTILDYYGMTKPGISGEELLKKRLAEN
jgi:aspartate ammonia-lyase